MFFNGILNAGHVSGTGGNVDRLRAQLFYQLQWSPYRLVVTNEGFLG